MTTKIPTIIVFNRWPTFDEDPMSSNYEDHGNDGEQLENNQDLEYQPYDDNRYNNAISDREYPWEEIGQFGNGHSSTSAEVIREAMVGIVSYVLDSCHVASILLTK